MKKILFILATIHLLLAQCPDLSAPGPFGTAYRTISSIPSEDETMTNSRCYFPAINDTVPLSAVPCPIISFGHGFMTSTDNYYSYAQHFASWGYVCIVPTISNPIFVPNHNYRARLMITAARYIMNLNFSPSDRFYNKLDCDNWAFVGHSMGGSISLLAGDRYVNYSDSLYHLRDTLRAIVAYGSPQSNPATVPSRITTPYMILSGTQDRIAPWNEVRSAFWVGSSAPGAFAVIAGANHTYFTDNYGHYLTDGTATITRDQQRAIARRHTTAFLNKFMRGDTTNCCFLYALGDSIRLATWMDTVEIRWTPVNVDDFRGSPRKIELLCFPNPFNAAVRISVVEAIHELPLQIEIYDLNGRKLEGTKELRNGEEFIWQPEPSFPSGVYLVRARLGKLSDYNNGNITEKKIVYLK